MSHPVVTNADTTDQTKFKKRMDTAAVASPLLLTHLVGVSVHLLLTGLEWYGTVRDADGPEPTIALHFLVPDIRDRFRFHLLTALFFLHGHRSVG